MTDLRADTMIGEQWVFEERTTDPSSTIEGERWLRTDIAPDSNQLATLRVDRGGSTLDVPIFATGTSKADVDEAVRVRVGGSTGYIPITATGDAAFPSCRVQHNSSTLAYHDGVEVSALPDSEIDRFEWGGPVSDRYDEISDGPAVIDTNSPVLEGSYSLKHDNSDYPNMTIVSYPNASYSGGNLPNYPQSGDRIGGFVYTTVEQSLGRTASPTIILAGVQGEESYYAVVFNSLDDQLKIEKVITGSKTNLNTATLSISSDEWYYLQIDYDYDSAADETTIEFTAFDTDSNGEPLLGNPLKSVSATDGDSRLQDNGDGGFGFRDDLTYVAVWDDWNLTRGGADI